MTDPGFGKGLLFRALDAWANETPDAIAVDVKTNTLSVRAWLDAARPRARELREAGVREGQRVALAMQPDLFTLISLVALEDIGADVLLFNAQGTEQESKATLDTFGAELLVVGAEAPVRLRAPRSSDPEGARGRFALATSGVTGRPKVVRRSWACALESARTFATMGAYCAEDRILCTTPMYHGFAFSTALTPCFVSRAALLLMPQGSLPTRAVCQADERRATVVQTIPYVYRAILSSGMTPPTGVRLFLSAGEALTSSLAEEWARRSRRSLSNHYGTTEVGMITLADEGDVESVGKLLDGVRVNVLPPTDGEYGELVIHTGEDPSYFGEDGANAIQDGWFRTGDMGYVGDDGRVFLKGRRSIRLNVAGNKVDPVEVEDAIRAYPAVKECAVVGRVDETGAEYIEARIVADDGFDELALRRHLVPRLSAYKIPRVTTRVPSLPRTASGKLRRGSL